MGRGRHIMGGREVEVGGREGRKGRQGGKVSNAAHYQHPPGAFGVQRRITSCPRRTRQEIILEESLGLMGSREREIEIEIKKREEDERVRVRAMSVSSRGRGKGNG